MEHVSLHGLAFAGLQWLIVMALHWGIWRWHVGALDAEGVQRRSRRALHGIPLLVGLGFVAWYIVLRTRPIERGADPFVYSLGVFDGVSLAGLGSLVLLHFLLVRRHGFNETGRA